MPATKPTAIEFGIGVLSARSLPEKKLREKIAARYSADETEAAIARLRELRMADDRAWAERYARDRFERLGKGRHRIRAELVAKGIEAATADAAIAAALGDDAEREKAAAVLASMRAKLGRSGSSAGSIVDGESEPTVRGTAPRSKRVPSAAQNLENRLFRRMLARGYPASLVRDLLAVS